MSARRNASRSRKGAQRSSVPRNYWRREAADLHLGLEDFHITAHQTGRGGKKLDLKGLVESVSWEDAGAVLTGTMTVRKPPGKEKFDMKGLLVKLAYSPREGAARREVWRMRCFNVSEGLKEGTIEVELKSSLYRLKQTRHAYKFTKGKAYPKGWPAKRVIRRVAKRAHFKVARLPKMRYRVKKLVEDDATPWDMILKVLRWEREESGRRFVLYEKRGRIAISPLKRSPHLLGMRKTLLDAQLQETIRKNFATALTVRATGGTKHKKKKIKVVVKSRALTKRYGLIHAEVKAPDGVNTRREARRYGKRLLRERAKPKQEISFSHPGIPSLRRNHAIMLNLPGDEFRQVVFVKTVSHSLSGGDYSMEVTLRLTDPFRKYDDERRERVRKKKCAAAKKAKRRMPKDCKKDGTPKPRTGSQRR